MSSLVATLRSARLRREMDAMAAAYSASQGEGERARVQLELLNEAWADLRRFVPRFQALSRELDLPQRWDSLEEFAQRVPTSSRATLQRERDASISTRRPPDRWSATGGSTSQPVQVPHWESEASATRPNQWLGRSWFGVAPEDRLFLLWGHSHLMGTGLRGWINARRRELDDRLLGYARFSAYDLSESAMRAAVERILDFRPAYIVGYSVALDRLERAAAAHRSRLRALGLKVVIATSEAFPYPDSAQRLSDTFGCPVAMEYGAVEALGMAYMHPDGGYRLFWRSYLAEAERRNGGWLLRLTSLYPRSLPLVRYEIGDEIELAPGSPDHAIGLVRFERVLGRCNQYVELADGTIVHSEAFSHAVRPCPAIRGFQVVQDGRGLCLRVVTNGGLPREEESGLRQRLAVVHADLAAIRLEPVDSLVQTTAGKTPMILRR